MIASPAYPPLIASAILAIGKDWWLPANYAKHGVEVDSLFNWIFWITVVTFVAVEGLLIVFLVQYRARPGRKKARYTHGDTRLEMIWTIAPAIILAVLAFASKRVWDDVRYSADLNDPGRTKVLVIGEQFKWNIIYPGPDGKFGRYLLFPKPTDITWPTGPNGKSVTFEGVQGPASLPYDKALVAIGRYIDSENRLGKDFTDPDGKDDDYQAALARTMYVPVNRPVEVQISSKDVIHDFYVPNLRTQLYAVPGMRGKIVFTPTTTTRDVESVSRQMFSVDDLPALLQQPQYKDLAIDIDERNAADGAVKDKTGWRFAVDPKNPKSASIIRNGAPINAGVPEKLKAAGVKMITAHLPGYLDIACAQICGLGHYSMQGRIIVLSQDEFDRKYPSVPHLSK